MVATSLACALPSGVAARDVPRRVVAYVDIDRPGARKGYEAFVTALLERRLGGRYGLEPVFVATDQSRAEELAALPARLRELRPFVVVATSLPTAFVVRDLGIPALFFAPFDPVTAGLVKSLQRPGGTMTGYASRAPSVAKMLEVLGDAFPAARRIAVLTDKRFLEEYGEDAESIRRAGEVARVDARQVVVEERQDFDKFVTQALDRFQALAIPYTKVPFLHGEHLVAELRRRKSLALLGSSRLVRAGGLMALEPDYSDADDVFLRQLAAIASGVPPGEIPVERSRIFRLSLNLDSLRAIGAVLPFAFVKRVDLLLP